MEIPLGVVTTVVSLTIGVLTFILTTRKNVKTDGQDQGALKSTVDYIARTADEIRLEQKDLARKVDAQNENIIRLEESHKQLRQNDTELKESIKDLTKRVDSLEVKSVGGN